MPAMGGSPSPPAWRCRWDADSPGDGMRRDETRGPPSSDGPLVLVLRLECGRRYFFFFSIQPPSASSSLTFFGRSLSVVRTTERA